MGKIKLQTQCACIRTANCKTYIVKTLSYDQIINALDQQHLPTTSHLNSHENSYR